MFYVEDCPENKTVFQWIYENSHFREAMLDVQSRCKIEELTFEHRLDTQKLESAVKKALDLYGFHGWVTSAGESPYYGGFSLMSNPHHKDANDPAASTLGTKTNSPDQFFYASIEPSQGQLKNSYFDTYSFTERTLPSKVDYLGTVLDSIEKYFSLTRGRCAVINGQIFEEKYKDTGWHRDETIFENLRLNIPVYGEKGNYFFQNWNGTSYELEIGKAYSWDTNKKHRAYAKQKANQPRANLVIGICPWLQYNESERGWQFNEYYGKVHPFELFKKISFLKTEST